MKPLTIIATLALLFLFSCDDDSSKTVELPKTENKVTGPIDVSGVVIDESSGEPIENVEIIGFRGGVHYGNLTVCYGEAVSLGSTDKCGQFKITLSDSIKGGSAHGVTNMTIVQLRLSRPDFGVKEVSIPFESGTRTLGLGPSPQPFFRSLYLVQSEDGKSVHIGWNIHSFGYWYLCPPCARCSSTSDGNLYIQRSDSPGYRSIIPIEINNQQMFTDSDLPSGNFDYTIDASFSVYGSHKANIIRTNSDTLFLIKPPESATLNHCN